MELLINIVTEHLKHHKRLVVPRLGAFLVKPDGRTVVFSEMLRNDDGVLHGLLTAAGLSELEADGLIDMQMSRSHIADPDPCVRGLKYGKQTGNKRKASVYIVSGAPRRRRRKKAAIVLTALLITAAAICYLLLRHGGGHTSRQQPAAPVERENATVMQADTPRLATVPLQPGQAASPMQHDAADEPSSNTQQNVAKRHGTPEPGAGAPAAARHYTTEQER